MNKDDLKIYINENNLIPEILESIGLVHIRPVGQKYYSCGFPESRRRDSINCYMNDELSVKVWSRNEDIKDLFSLIKYQLNCNFFEAINFAAEVCGIKLTNKKMLNIERFMRKPKKREVVFEKPKIKPLRLAPKDMFVREECDLFTRDGINREAQEYFQVCFDPIEERVVFPIKDFETGEIISYKGRTIRKDYIEKGIAKYYYYYQIEGRWQIFGLYENYHDILDNDELFVFEAEKSPMQAYSMKIRNCVSVNKKKISDEQAYILNKLNKKIIIAFDEDVEEWEIRQQCKKLKGDVYYIYSKGKIPKKCSPTDCSYDVFKQLYNNKIKYEE